MAEMNLHTYPQYSSIGLIEVLHSRRKAREEWDDILASLCKQAPEHMQSWWATH